MTEKDIFFGLDRDLVFSSIQLCGMGSKDFFVMQADGDIVKVEEGKYRLENSSLFKEGLELHCTEAQMEEIRECEGEYRAVYAITKGERLEIYMNIADSEEALKERYEELVVEHFCKVKGINTKKKLEKFIEETADFLGFGLAGEDDLPLLEDMDEESRREYGIELHCNTDNARCLLCEESAFIRPGEGVAKDGSKIYFYACASCLSTYGVHVDEQGTVIDVEEIETEFKGPAAKRKKKTKKKVKKNFGKNKKKKK